MDTYKIQSTVKNGQLIIDLPVNFDNTNVEVVVSQIGYAAVSDKPRKDMSKYIGIFKNKQTIEQIDEQLQNIRNEWARDFS